MDEGDEDGSRVGENAENGVDDAGTSASAETRTRSRGRTARIEAAGDEDDDEIRATTTRYESLQSEDSMSRNGTNNGGESVCSTNSGGGGAHGRQDSIRSGKSVTISIGGDSFGEKEEMDCRSGGGGNSSVYGWKVSGGGYRAAPTAGRSLTSIQENSGPTHAADASLQLINETDGRRGTMFSRDIRYKVPSVNPNPQLLAVSYPSASAHDRKNKNIKVSTLFIFINILSI